MSVSMATTSSSATTTGPSQDDSPSPAGRRHPDNSRLDSDGGQPTQITPAAPPRNDASNDSQNHSQSQATNDEEEWLMACRCESGKTLVTLLSCLQHVAENPSDTQATATAATQSSVRRQKKHNTIQPVTVFCTPSGFTFHVFGPAKQSEASCELQKTMFSHYQVHEEENQEDWQTGGEFCVNLMSVLDSLQLLGPLDNRTSVGMSYNLQSEIFKVELLLEGVQGVLCTSAIPSLMAPADDPEGDSLSNAFRSSPVAARMMVRSGILRELLPEWSNVAGASCASVAVSNKRGLELAVLGHYGECWVQVPATGDHMVAALELANEKKTVTRTYPLHSLLSSMKGLEIAEETCIHINSEGIMAIQHKTPDPTGQGHSFVDFIMTCLEDEEDEEDDEQEDANTAAGEEDASTRASVSQSQTTRNSSSQLTYQQSPDTATTTATRRRRRRRQRSQDPVSVASNVTGEDVEQGSSDTDDEGGTPSERQKRQAIQKRKQEESESSSDEETRPVVSAKPLFGSVVARGKDKDNNKGDGKQSKEDTPPRRRQRRSASRPPRRSKSQKKAKRKDDGDASDASRNMLESSEDESEEKGMQHARTPAARHNRDDEDDGCSSPELVYGQQM